MKETLYTCDGCGKSMPMTVDTSVYFGADCVGCYHFCNAACVGKAAQKIAEDLKAKVK